MLSIIKQTAFETNYSYGTDQDTLKQKKESKNIIALTRQLHHDSLNKMNEIHLLNPTTTGPKRFWLKEFIKF